MLRRELLEHHGEHYDIPYSGPGATGLGKPLKLMARPLRADVPIYLASMGPKSVELAFEIADGWIPLFFQPERAREIFPMSGARDGFDIAPSVPAVLLDDVQAARDALKAYYALYIGGMGARGKNFYNDLVCQYGFEKEAKEIQDLYLSGNKRDAEKVVPLELLELGNLVGPASYVKERIAAFAEAGVTDLQVLPVSDDPPATVRQLKELVG